MLVSLKWLRDYVDIDLDAQTFGDKMTMTGTKTETVEYYGQDISNVVVDTIFLIVVNELLVYTQLIRRTHHTI